MKTSHITTRVAVVIGLVLGSFALTALAQNVFVGPPGPPPACPAGYTGCDAPLNVSATAQSKTGLLSLQNFLFNPTAAAIPVGAVLSAKDATGLVEWKTLAGVGPTQTIPENYTVYATGNSSTDWVVPAGITRVRVRMWGGGGGGGAFDSGVSVGGGGGSGAYAEGIVSVTPGSTYTIKVGKGGPGGVTGSGQAARCGTNGDASSFGLKNSTSLLVANGGNKGHGNCGDGNLSSGGWGGSFTIAAGVSGFGIQGGDGATGNTGQSEGGSAPMGGAGSSRYRYSAPNNPGGGGGGGVSGDPYGFTGSSGKVVIEY
jgi:hypothetical protein